MLLTNNESNNVTVIDAKSYNVVQNVPTGKGTHGIVTSNDNKFVYVTNMYENTVSVIDNNTNKVIGTVAVGEIPNGITYKP
ncbi:hypothetical protein PIPA1_43420 [Pelosinus sp. IPA-1]|nr:hypothetical protein PIPA1_43420 [Pelosinus sp. IPA-1]